MKDCEATTMMVDLAEVEQIVDKLERGEEVRGVAPLIVSDSVSLILHRWVSLVTEKSKRRVRRR